jgi:hypothetical protein
MDLEHGSRLLQLGTSFVDHIKRVVVLANVFEFVLVGRDRDFGDLRTGFHFILLVDSCCDDSTGC